MSLQTYRRTTPEPAWPARALLAAETARIFLLDILPILARHWTRQQLRNALSRLTFLTQPERKDIERWLHARGL